MGQRLAPFDRLHKDTPPPCAEPKLGRDLEQAAEAVIKRAFDIVVALASLIVLSPWFALIALLIKLDSPGPVFYRGKRIGKDGKPFWMLKFRTMNDTPVDKGPRVTAHDDPRVTRFGRILRDTKLNELPQFVNVLKGEMSLVGPRPEDPKYVSFYTPQQRRVLSVTPGITSVASVMYHDEEEMLSQNELEHRYVREIMPQKLLLDLEYVDRRSFLVDLDILLQTVRVVLPLFAQASPQIEELFFGPVQHFIRRHLSWFILDLLLALGAILTAKLVWWRAGMPMYVESRLGIVVVAGMALTFTLMNQLRGLHHCMWSCAGAEEVIDILLSTAMSSALLVLVNRLIPSASAEWILLSGFFAFVAFTAGRYRKRFLTGLFFRWRSLWSETRHQARQHLLVVGTGPVAEGFAWQVQHRREARYHEIVGFVDDDLAKQGLRIHGLEVLGTLSAIPTLVTKYHVDTVIITERDIDLFKYQGIAEACQRTSVDVKVIPDVLQIILGPDAALPDSGQRTGVHSKALPEDGPGSV